MAALFSSPAMALGYARSRPPLHRRIVDMARLPRVDRALDIGCGSGLSTRALAGTAALSVGIEPVESMVRIASTVAPAARFVHGSAESLPFGPGCFDLLTAAGSLNYVDLDLFFPEASRVLTPGGILLVYDFSQGRSFRDAETLDEWFVEFARRYPPPPAHGRRLDPDILGALPSGMRVASAEDFELSLAMTASAYTDYMMTETNVSNAIEAGATEQDVRSWCAAGIEEAFGAGQREVLFRGYYAIMRR